MHHGRVAPRAALALLAVVLLAAGCKRDGGPRPGHRVTCVCTYLTDFDDTARIEVDVCIDDQRDTPREAAHCALQNAHNRIDECACQPPREPCDAAAPGACVNR